MYAVFAFRDNYQSDLEDSDWVQCACNRWLYEDYITDVVRT